MKAMPQQPKTVQITRKPIDQKEYIKRSARDTDYSNLITESTIITDENNRIAIVYLVIPEIPDFFTRVLTSIEYHKNRRIAGLTTEGAIFGYMPREQIRKDYCSSTALAVRDPSAHKAICNFGKFLTKLYKQHAPEVFQQHSKIMKDSVLEEWSIPETPFTSGIINKNNQLKYHKDAGNFNKVYSNMVCFKKGCKGGYLSIPEFDIGLDIANKSILLFDGQDIVHGVTPFRLATQYPKSYRFTIVYYSLKQMWQCKPITEELDRIRTKKTEREIKRYKRLTGEIPNEF